MLPIEIIKIISDWKIERICCCRRYYIKYVQWKKTLIGKDRCNDDPIEETKKDFPEDSDKLEEALHYYVFEKDLSTLKTEFPERDSCLSDKLVCPSEEEREGTEDFYFLLLLKMGMKYQNYP